MSRVRTRLVRVQCLQLDQRPGESLDARRARVADAVATGPDADVVVLPELWDVGYFGFDRYAEAAAPLPDALGSLPRLAANRGVTIVAGSVIERSADGLHNTVAVLGPDGSVLGTYRKVHLFGYRSRETELLTPGDGPAVVDTPAGRLGLATCFDLRFPEHFAAMVNENVDAFVVPAAWPATRASHWRVLVAARAIETQTPVVACGGTGNADGVVLAGATLVIDARGSVLADGGVDAGWVGAVVDHDDTRAWREEFPMRSEAREVRVG